MTSQQTQRAQEVAIRMSEQLATERAAAFEAAPVAMLILNVDLSLADANSAYLATTNRDIADLVGRNVFDAFPANPDHPEGDGVNNLRSSLHHVLERREPHSMAVQRYDLWVAEGPDEDAHGFVEKYWYLTNSPIFDDDGRLTGILNSVEDLTGFHQDLDAARTFYRDEIDAQHETDEAMNLRFADYAKIAMRRASNHGAVVEEVAHLRAALSSRAVIDQAKGILMAERRCGSTDAFALLVRQSQDRNVKLRDVAQELVDRTIDRRIRGTG